MPEVNLLAVLVATIAAFVSGGTYYAVFGEQLAEVSDAPPRASNLSPGKLALIHGGDWLMKMLVVAVSVTVWQ